MATTVRRVHEGYVRAYPPIADTARVLDTLVEDLTELRQGLLRGTPLDADADSRADVCDGIAEVAGAAHQSGLVPPELVEPEVTVSDARARIQEHVRELARALADPSTHPDDVARLGGELASAREWLSCGGL